MKSMIAFILLAGGLSGCNSYHDQRLADGAVPGGAAIGGVATRKAGGAMGDGVTAYKAGGDEPVAVATGLTELLWPTEIATAKVSI